MLSVNIIGAGVVGQTFGYLLAKHAVATIQAVINRTEHSTARALQFIGQGQAYCSLGDLPPADLTLLTVADRHIPEVAEELATHPHLRSGSVVMHCSGALTSACLASLRAKHCAVASFHPAMSLKHPQWSVQHFAHTPCAVEGDPVAVTLITDVFTAIGADVYQIAPEHKALYHAAAVFATNYQVILLQQAFTSFVEAGLTPSRAKTVVDRFLQTVQENIQQVSEPRHALTGPVQRGDVETIQRHLQALPDPLVRNLYVCLAKETMTLAHLEEAIAEKMRQILHL